jgi:NAD(P)-dependent dehydrogenase (short-subunit alcohol dehydrogenase family)
MTGRLEGRVALTIGAVQGQGWAHATRSAEAGPDLVLADVRAQEPLAPYPMGTVEGPTEVAEHARGAGRRVVTAEVDIRDELRLKSGVGRAVAELARLDVVVADAASARRRTGMR